jgi:hypothetical protein
LQEVRPVLRVQGLEPVPVPERVLRLQRRCLLLREPELREQAQARQLERNLLQAQELQRELPAQGKSVLVLHVQALGVQVLRVLALQRERLLELVHVQELYVLALRVQERLPEPVRAQELGVLAFRALVLLRERVLV